MLAWIVRAFQFGRALEWLVGGGAAAIALGAIAFSHEHPLVAGALFVLGGQAVVGGVLFWLYGARRGLCSPRYLGWYRLPIHRVSWEFFGVGMFKRQGHSLKITGFQCRFRANRPIQPKRLLIEFDSGKSFDLRHSEAGGAGTVDTIEQLPVGRWIHVGVRFSQQAFDDDAPTIDQFFNEYGAFSLVFEHDKGTFRRRFRHAETRAFVFCQLEHMSPTAKQAVRVRAATS